MRCRVRVRVRKGLALTERKTFATVPPFCIYAQWRHFAYMHNGRGTWRVRARVYLGRGHGVVGGEEQLELVDAALVGRARRAGDDHVEVAAGRGRGKGGKAGGAGRGKDRDGWEMCYDTGRARGHASVAVLEAAGRVRKAERKPVAAARGADAADDGQGAPATLAPSRRRASFLPPSARGGRRSAADIPQVILERRCRDARGCTRGGAASVGRDLAQKEGEAGRARVTRRAAPPTAARAYRARSAAAASP